MKFYLYPILICALLLTGCSGGDDKESKPDDKPVNSNDRAGYFDGEDSLKLNAALISYNKALALTYDQKRLDACNKRADLLASQLKLKEAMACHINESNSMIKQIGNIKTTLKTRTTKDLRNECKAEIKTFDAYLGTYQSAWMNVKAGWQAYANKNFTRSDQVLGDIDAARAVGDEMPMKLEQLAKACYTKADIAEAAKAEQASKTTTK